MATKKQTFNIQAKITIETALSINADSLADAVEASKGLKFADFVELHGENWDNNSVEITGAFKT